MSAHGPMCARSPLGIVPHMSTQPTLADELFLLAHRPDTGKGVTDGTALTVGVAGALVAELAVTERIELDAKRVTVINHAPVGDPELDGLLARIAGEPRPRKPDWWITKLNKRDLPRRVATRLAAHGVIRDEEHRVLGLFPAHRYPELDPRLRQEIIGRLRAAFGGERPSARTAALVALLNACGMDRKVFPDMDRRMLKHRAKEISEAEWAGEATRKVIQGIRAAAAASVAASAGAAAGSS